MATDKAKKIRHGAATSTVTALRNRASSKPAKRKDRPECVVEARYVRSSQMFLRFADGLEGTWTFSHLGVDMSDMKLTSIEASASGACVNVESKSGEGVELDASSLRVCVDSDYAAEMEKRLDALASKIG